jgi:hypothetical protein
MKAYKFFKIKARLIQTVDIIEKAVEEISDVVIIAVKEVVEAEKEETVEQVKDSVEEESIIQSSIEEVKLVKKKKNEQPIK